LLPWYEAILFSVFNSSVELEGSEIVPLAKIDIDMRKPVSIVKEVLWQLNTYFSGQEHLLVTC
jgi:hypothetical protein